MRAQIMRGGFMAFFVRAFKRPPAFIIGLFWFVALVYYVFVMYCVINLLYTAWAIVAYCLFPFILTYTIYTAIISVEGIGRVIVKILNRTSGGRRFVQDYGFRTNFFSTVTTFINFFYVIYNLAITIFTQSLWYGSLTIAYAILCIMRVYVVNCNRKQLAEGEVDYIKSYNTFINIGIAILFYALAFSLVVYQMTAYQFNKMYMDFVLYVIIGYTIYKIIIAIISLFTVMQYGNPIWQSIRNIVLADAMVSLSTLIYSLLARMFPAEAFGVGVSIVNGIVGGLACFGMAMLGILFIVSGIRGNKKMKRYGYPLHVRISQTKRSSRRHGNV